MRPYRGNGNMFSEVDPTIKEFRENFERVATEISTDGVTVNSHKLKAGVRVRCVNNDKEYVLVGIDVDMLPGCGCWDGIVLEIEEEE